MKRSNFLRFDPSYEGKGLDRGNKLEEIVWNKYSSNQSKLIEINNTIVKNIDSLDVANEDQSTNYMEDAEEGRLLTKVHQVRERNKRIVKDKKKSTITKFGTLKCEVCEFDFRETYGELGDGFAECHHIKPVSESDPNSKTRLSDLAIVCANCHRMIHRSRPWKSIEELKALLH
ncbi:MAG: 5-methylcytosine-specific restriction protein A [Flavobacteriales bacterium]|jgi:5-methylcytosine-specific restriction protein A